VPIESEFSANLIAHDNSENVFTVYDDVSGVAFMDNILMRVNSPEFSKGFRRERAKLKRATNGLLYPVDDLTVGVRRDLAVTTKEETGVDWYPKSEPIIAFQSGDRVRVSPGEGVLFNAVRQAEAGDVIILQAGNYAVSKLIKIDKPLTIRGDGRVDLTFERSALFEIQDGGSLRLSGLHISGSQAPDNAGNAVIRTSPYSMLENYRLEIIDTHIYDLDVNHSFNVVAAAKGTFADNILIRSSSFKEVTGAVLKLDKESDDYGIYNAEYLTISKSTVRRQKS